MAEPARVDEFIPLFTRFEPRLFGYILTLIPNVSDAEEVLQETNLILWKKFDTFEKGSNFFAWACQIARLEVKRHCRRPDRKHLAMPDDVIDAVARDTIEMAEELAARRRILAGCVSQLPDRDRQLLAMRYVQRDPVRDVAAALGESMDAIYKALSRARRALAECVQRGMTTEGFA